MSQGSEPVGIMRRRFAVGVAVATLALSACGSIAEQLTETAIEQGQGVDNVEIDTDGDGSVSIEFEGDDGESGSIDIGGAIPSDFPAPIPSGISEGSSSTFESSEGVTRSAFFTVDADRYDEMVAMYEDWIDGLGFDVQKQTFTGEFESTTLIGGDDDSEAGAIVSVAREENETLVTITLNE